MSSKLVQKSLRQAAAPTSNNSSRNISRKRNTNPATNRSTVKLSKEEMVQEHIESMLRLDNLVQRNTSSTAQKSFDRHSSNLKQQQKQKQSSKRNTVAVSNSRSTSSSFAKLPQEKRFCKEREKRKREEGYFRDLAKALKKAKKGKKK